MPKMIPIKEGGYEKVYTEEEIQQEIEKQLDNIKKVNKEIEKVEIKIPKSWSKDYKRSLLEKLLKENDDYLIKKMEEYTDPDIKPVNDFMDEAEERINHPEKNYGIKSKFTKIDSYLGGFGKGELIVVSGQTGGGKTLLTQAIALNIALDCIPVLFFTFEMPAVEITTRFRSMALSSAVNVPPEFARELPIYLNGKMEISTIEGLRKSIEFGKEKFGVQLVIIDHLHFFLRSGENQTNEVGVITRELKKLAIEFDLPIILVAHIRKLNHKGIPTLDDLKDSSSIAQDADSVLMVWRDQDDQQNRYMKVRIRKNRRRGFLKDIDFVTDDNLYPIQQVLSKNIDDY